MLKTIDKFILKRFFGPFLLTFCICLFIFLTQTFIRQFKHFVGKDLGLDVLGEMFFYFGLVLTPVALPLAALLASLMSFGSLGQHSELTAIKGAGISLIRILIPVGIFVVFVTIGAFLFNDTISPIANLKAYSLLYDIKQKKPTLQFNEGEFYDGLPGYSIKVEEKRGENGEELYGMMIYNHTAKKGNTDLIIAEHGRMYSYGNDNYLVLEMINGSRYTELSAERNRRHEAEYIRNDFDSSRIVFSMESFGLKKTKEELFKNHNMMKTSRQLAEERDSLAIMSDNLFANLPSRVQGYHQYQYYTNNEERKRIQREKTKDELKEDENKNKMPVGNHLANNTPKKQEKKKTLVIDKKVVKLSQPRRESIIEELLERKRQREKTKKKDDALIREKANFALERLKTRQKDSKTPSPVVTKTTKKDAKEMKGELDKIAEAENVKKKGQEGNVTKQPPVNFNNKDAQKADMKALRRQQGKINEEIEEALDDKEGLGKKIEEEVKEVKEIWETEPNKRMLNMAWSKANGVKGTVMDTKKRMDRNVKKLADYQIDLYMKISRSVIVFVMFLIGAPLGAIIKKGGLGVPVLVAILFFMIYYITTIIGERFAEEMVVSPLIGVWSGTMLLFVIGLFCLRQAYHDARLFDLDYYKVMLGKLFGVFKKG